MPRISVASGKSEKMNAEMVSEKLERINAGFDQSGVNNEESNCQTEVIASNSQEKY